MGGVKEETIRAQEAMCHFCDEESEERTFDCTICGEIFRICEIHRDGETCNRCDHNLNKPD